MSDQDQDKDPVVHSTLSGPLFIWSALLLLSLGWALYDESQTPVFEADGAEARRACLRRALALGAVQLCAGEEPAVSCSP